MEISSLIEGYANGYFLMSNDDGGLGWYYSKKRALIPLDERFRYPTSLQRVINQERFDVAINRDFRGVCEGCANRPSTWISAELIEIYQKLHQAGWAHSFETWQDNQLAGGILGIAIRGIFIGESMFYTIPEASKVALVKLVEHLKRRQYMIFDAQMQNPHLARFGSYLVSDRSYQKLLGQALKRHCLFRLT